MLPRVLIISLLIALGVSSVWWFKDSLNTIIPKDKTGSVSSSFTLIRQYPNFVKCSWVPASKVPEVAEKLDTLKQLGFNTVCIMPPLLAVNPDKEPMQRFSKQVAVTLPKIKKGGFAIFIALDDTPEGLEAARKQKLTSEQFAAYFEKEALQWASIAEENQVEYFSPANELQSRLKILKTAYMSDKEAMRQSVEETNTWHRKMLPKLRKIFKGKLIAKFGEFTPGLNASGYDFFGYTIGFGYSTNFETFRQQVKDTYRNSINLAEKGGNRWLVAELYLPHIPQSNKPAEVQDDYHKITIEELIALPTEDQPKGFVATGYGPGGFTPMTDEATAVVKKFFTTR